jgi:ketol-acid reductoisomerase
MMEKISTTAAFGAHGASRSIVTAQTKQAFAEILANIQSGKFAQQFIKASNEDPNWRAKTMPTETPLIQKVHNQLNKLDEQR